MGCLPSSCSIPCCCCCCVDDYTCCPCCPCLFLCGCRIKAGRCICRIRKYADTSGINPEEGGNNENEAGANTEAAGVTPRKRTRCEDKSGVVRWGGAKASGDTPVVAPEGGETWTGDVEAPLEITDPVLGVVVRPASSISQSTGMEPMVSDDSRTPSMISDGGSDISSRTDSEREGVCIDGKFYPKRPDTATPGRAGGPSLGSEFTVNSIISVHIANKVSQRTRRDDEDSPEDGGRCPPAPPPSAAPRRLAKIDIKEERKKIMSELSLFKKKPKRRKQKKRKVTGQVNVTFDPDLDLGPGDPKTQMQVMQDQEQSSSSPRSMHISSAEDDSSGVENVRIHQIVSSRAKLTLCDVTPRNVTVDPLPDNDVSNQENTSTTSSSAEDNDTVTKQQRMPSLITENGDGGSHSESQQSEEHKGISKNGSIRGGKKTTTRSHTPASIFTAAALNSNPLSRNAGNDRPSARGLAMSRHFQGQGQQQFSAFKPGGSTSGSMTARPQSAVGSRTAPSGMWTLGGGGGDSEGGRGVHSAGNSDQDSVGSGSHGRPHSTYGIRAHSEAVHSLQRWRNLKVNPF